MPGPYDWSKPMFAIRRTHWIDPIRTDARTNQYQNVLLGHPSPDVRELVLECGLTDFSCPYELEGQPSLSPEEKVLLYCYVNLKRHFFANVAVFETFKTEVTALLRTVDPLLVIDVGCGPATACLALADRFPGHRFNYIGIDSAPAMLDKARSLWEAALTCGLIGEGSMSRFHRSWTEVVASKLTPRKPVLVVFSYFFANPSIRLDTVRSVAGFVRTLANGRDGNLLVAYLNSANPLCGPHYDQFARYLGFDPRVFQPSPMTVELRGYRDNPPDEEEIVYDFFPILGD